MILEIQTNNVFHLDHKTTLEQDVIPCSIVKQKTPSILFIQCIIWFNSRPTLQNNCYQIWIFKFMKKYRCSLPIASLTGT